MPSDRCSRGHGGMTARKRRAEGGFDSRSLIEDGCDGRPGQNRLWLGGNSFRGNSRSKTIRAARPSNAPQECGRGAFFREVPNE